MTSKRKHRYSTNSSGKESESSSPIDKRYRATESVWNVSPDDHVFTYHSNMSADIAESLKLISHKLEKLDNLEILINKTLNKLEAVETQVNQLTIRVESLESKSPFAEKVPCEQRPFDLPR